MPTEAGDNAELVRRMRRELLESRDLATVDRYFGDGFVSHNTPPGLPDGVEGVKRFFAMFRGAFPDLEVAIDEIVSEGDRVAVATTMRGTHRGELLGLAPTGRRVAVTGVDIVRLEDGKIVEHRGLTDTVGLLQQLGGD
jgi:steroid delta-isomerase-like uncharacterized protein